MITFIILALLLAGMWFLFVTQLKKETRNEFDTMRGEAWTLLFVNIFLTILYIIFLLMSIIIINKGDAAVYKPRFGGQYTHVSTTVGTQIVSPFTHVEIVDIKNKSTEIPINTVRDGKINVSGSITIVYDMDPERLPELLNTNSTNGYSIDTSFKSNIMYPAVQKIFNNNSSFTKSGTISEVEELFITKQLESYGFNVKQIYVSSYIDTNNYQINNHDGDTSNK